MNDLFRGAVQGSWGRLAIGAYLEGLHMELEMAPLTKEQRMHIQVLANGVSGLIEEWRKADRKIPD